MARRCHGPGAPRAGLCDWIRYAVVIHAFVERDEPGWPGTGALGPRWGGCGWTSIQVASDFGDKRLARRPRICDSRHMASMTALHSDTAAPAARGCVPAIENNRANNNASYWRVRA